MTQILREAESKKKAQGGKPNKLSVEDRLLMAMGNIYENIGPTFTLPKVMASAKAHVIETFDG